VLQRLGLSDSLTRVPEDRLDDLEGSEGRFAVCLDPEAQVFEKFALEDRLSILRG
jgi:hypothetical protein